ncbi:OmpA family protein [Arundinibacter roseus]|nr:OmpA family protein [Arundinibacter roseus]
MRFVSFIVLLATFCLQIEPVSGQVTRQPYVEERYSRSVRILQVELTDRYTIIDMQYGEPATQQMFRMQPFSTGGSIGFDPQSRLYKPGDTRHRFNFIKAEGIPESPASLKVRPGEVVRFKVYFERLDPGIEVFDLYEGRNPDQTEYWNFYGVHITNPARKKPVAKAPAPTKTPPPAKVQEPEPTPTPAEPPLLDKVPDELPVQEPEFITLAGTVFDAKTNKPLSARLYYREETDTLSLNTSSGKYRLGLNKTQRYTVGVQAKGYLNGSLLVSPADSAANPSLRHDFYLTPLAEGTSVTLNKIYFATSQYQLLSESFDELNGLVELLKENPGLKIRIEGHTDSVGDFEKNVELSRNRADAVRTYLIEKGIDTSRLEAKGYGPTRPVSKGNSEEERQKNRRVEFVILGT